MIGKNSLTYRIKKLGCTLQFNKNLGLCDIIFDDEEYNDIRSAFLGRYQGQQFSRERISRWTDLLIMLTCLDGDHSNLPW